MKPELYLIEVIKGKRKGFFASFLRAILAVFSCFYEKLVRLRNFAFDSGWFRRYRPPVPMIISIGNIVAGGTGKTPVTLLVAQEIHKDFRIAILSRGYRSPAEKLSRPTILCNGRGPLHSASYCGDEPYLLSQNLPESLVIVGRNRHKASDLAARAGAQVILLDDGMQHRHLVRDREVVVMDAADPFGQGHFLPRGLLREDVKSLARAHLVIMNHVRSSEQFAAMKEMVAAHTKAPIVGTQMRLEKIFSLDGKEIDSIKGKRVGIFCGIAQPDNFRDTVLAAGADIVETYYVPDHRAFDSKEFQDFVERCCGKQAEMVLCTEKDRVKLPESLPSALPVAWLKMRLCLIEGVNEWATFIEKVKREIARQI